MFATLRPNRASNKDGDVDATIPRHAHCVVQLGGALLPPSGKVSSKLFLLELNFYFSELVSVTQTT